MIGFQDMNIAQFYHVPNKYPSYLQILSIVY